MTYSQKINRIAYAMEKMFSINPNFIKNYQNETQVFINPGIFQQRTRGLLMDNIYLFNRLVYTVLLIAMISKRTYVSKFLLFGLQYYVVMDLILPKGLYSILEMNRMNHSRGFSKKYFKNMDGNMTTIETILDPRTRIAHLKKLMI